MLSIRKLSSGTFAIKFKIVGLKLVIFFLSFVVSLDVELDQYDDTIQSIWEHKVHLDGYDAEVTPEVLRKGGKATYVERNQIMIDLSDYCIFYYDENYRPERRERSRKYFTHNLTSAQSGTELAYRYAVRKKKTIINVFN